MGITVSSKSYSCTMGYMGFRSFRILVAEKFSDEVGRHYSDLEKAMLMFGERRDKFFENYDKKTDNLIKENKLDEDVAIFLYKSDCEGELNHEQTKKVFELIKNEDDEIIFGYTGRIDCAKMKDMKLIFSEETTVDWY